MSNFQRLLIALATGLPVYFVSCSGHQVLQVRWEQAGQGLARVVEDMAVFPDPEQELCLRIHVRDIPPGVGTLVASVVDDRGQLVSRRASYAVDLSSRVDVFVRPDLGEGLETFEIQVVNGIGGEELARASGVVRAFSTSSQSYRLRDMVAIVLTIYCSMEAFGQIRRAGA